MEKRAMTAVTIRQVIRAAGHISLIGNTNVSGSESPTDKRKDRPALEKTSPILSFFCKLACLLSFR
jgi:hypothetical protein